MSVRLTVENRTVNDTSTGGHHLFCKEYQVDNRLAAVASLQIVASCLAVFVNYVLVRTLINSTGHTGAMVRTLMMNLTVAGMIRSMYLIGRGGYWLALTVCGFERLTIDPILCAVLELPYGLADMTTIATMLCIGVDRLLSVVRAGKRRQSEETAEFTARLLSIGCWIQSLIIYSLIMASKLADDRSPVCFCDYKYLPTYTASAIGNGYFGAQELTVLAVYLFIYWKSRRRVSEFNLRTVKHSLQERVDDWINVRTTRMLLPPTMLHACIFVVSLFALIPLSGQFLESPTADIMTFTSAMQLTFALDLILHPMLCIRFNDRLRSVIGQSWPRLYWLFGAKRPVVGPSIGASSLVTTATHARSMIDVEGRQKKLKEELPADAVRALAENSNGLGAKKIVEFRVRPDTHSYILENLWMKLDTRPPRCNRSES